jgi:hypothetical protein
MGLFTRMRHYGLAKFHGGPVRYEQDIPYVHLLGDKRIEGHSVRIRGIADRVQIVMYADGLATTDAMTARKLAAALTAAAEAVEQGKIFVEQTS